MPPRLTAPSLELPRARRSPWSLLASVLLHVALVGALVLARWQGVLSWHEVLQAGAPGASPRGGGGGGGGIIVVALPSLSQPRASVAPPVPTPASPTATTPDRAPTVVAAADTASAAAGMGGTGAGGGSGTGTGTGSGSGVGPGSGSGTGGGAGGAGGTGTPPEPRQLILPPLDYPRTLRGQTVAVTFWVNTAGRVERVAIVPEIEDGGFRRKFLEAMRNYRFRPARAADGSPVPGTTTISVTF